MPARATVWPYRLVSPSASIIRELTGASITVMPRRSAATAGRPLAGTGRHPDEGDTRERILDIAMDLFIEGVRLSCALGALLTSLMSLSDLEDLGPAAYGDLLREAITDLLEPRGGR